MGLTSRSAAGVHAGLSPAPNLKPDLEVRCRSGDPPHLRRRDFHLYGWPGGPWRLLAVAAPSDGRGSETTAAQKQREEPLLAVAAPSDGRGSETTAAQKQPRLRLE